MAKTKARPMRSEKDTSTGANLESARDASSGAIVCWRTKETHARKSIGLGTIDRISGKRGFGLKISPDLACSLEHLMVAKWVPPTTKVLRLASRWAYWLASSCPNTKEMDVGRCPSSKVLVLEPAQRSSDSLSDNLGSMCDTCTLGQLDIVALA